MSGRFSLTAQLNSLTNFLLVLALLATGCGMALIVRQAHEASASLQLTLAQLPVYRQALLLVEAISAERGPTNAMLGERDGDPQALVRARALSDERLAHLQQALQGCPECSVTAEQVTASYQRLRQARVLVDQRLNLPASDPGRPTVGQVINTMFQAADANFRTADFTLQDLASRTPGIAACLVNTKLASRLRDTAGRLGSLLTPALQAARAPTAEEREQLQQTRGSLNQLVDLLRGNLEGNAADAERDRFQQLRERYLGQGLAFYQQTLASLVAGQPLSAAAFAHGYVPAMTSILDLRDTALSLAEGEAARLAREAHQRLLLTIAAALGILLVLGTGLLLLKRRLLSPLLANTQRLLTLTRRHMPAGTIADDEPRTLFAAFQRLEDEMHQAELLRQERDALIAELGVRAETDYLTGLANRRAFERQLAQGVVDTPYYLAAIAFDVDHFKRINDTYGHGAGDLLLQHLAQRCSDLLREGDRIARIGGEEFAVLADVKQAAEALALAERLRRGIAETPFAVGPTEALTVTASFGVAVTAKAEPGARVRLLAEADAALYRAKHSGRNCSEIAVSS